MGQDPLYSEARYVTEFQYDVSDPNDSFTLVDFERVRCAVVKWGGDTDTPVQVKKTQKGFEVAITHPLKDGHPFGMSLFIYLSAGVLRQLEDDDIRIAPSIIFPRRQGLPALRIHLTIKSTTTCEAVAFFCFSVVK